jgi:hypothetical protein
MMYAINAHKPNVMPEVAQDLANFLLIRGPFAWLGHGWKGCSQVGSDDGIFSTTIQPQYSLLKMSSSPRTTRSRRRSTWITASRWTRSGPSLVNCMVAVWWY